MRKKGSNGGYLTRIVMKKFWLIPIILFVLDVSASGATIYAITDLHHTDKPDRDTKRPLSGPRFYSESIGDLTICVNDANANAADAIIELGDYVEDSGDSGGQADLAAIEAVYANFNGPRYHVIGNWDIFDDDFITADDFFALIENGEPNDVSTIDSFPINDPNAYFPDGSASSQPISRYYAFNLPGGIKGVVLDGTGNLNNSDTYVASIGLIPETQLVWLDSYLAANSSFPIVVFTHCWLWPQINDYYNVKNASSVRDIIETYGNVIAVFQGHHHPGAQGWWADGSWIRYSEGLQNATGVFGEKHNGIKYYCLRSAVCGWGASPVSTANKVGGDNPDAFPYWTENTPSNAYYKITIDTFFGREEYDVQVEGFGTNPGGLTDIVSQADIDLDDDVDFYDLMIMAGQWQQAPGTPSADIAPETPDGIVNLKDFAVLAKDWLEGI